MRLNFKPSYADYRTCIFLLLWVFLWFFPWQRFFPTSSNLYLVLLLDMICLGIAMIGFILPGIFLFLLVDDHEGATADIAGIIPVGFAFSIFLIAVIGLAGRITGVSFQTVKVLFALAGTIEWFLLRSRRTLVGENHKGFHPFGDQRISPREYWPLLIVILLSVLLTFHDKLLFIDDLTYMAYLTNWQYSLELGFNNLVHQSDIIEVERFWLALYPMGHALLADLSGVPGILLTTNYLELFLVPIAVFTSYWFGRELKLSRKAAILSVLIQISLFSWMIGEEWPVGKWFFESMGEDKVSAVFHLAPVFFVFVLRFLQQPSRRHLMLITLSGLALTLTHPVILFFSCMIALGLTFLSWLTKRSDWKTVLIMVAGVAALLLPYLVIKLYNYSSQIGFAADTSSVSATYQIERYTNVVSDIFYGLNPGVLLFFDIPPESSFYQPYQAVRLLPALVTFLAGVLALARWRRGPLYWYIFISAFLIMIATIPYTGWILGYFLDARLIARVSWFMPVGLGSILILKHIAKRLEAIRSFRVARNSTSYAILRGYFFWILLSLVFISPLIVFRTLYQAPKYFALLEHNLQLSKIGSYIDHSSPNPVTVIALNYTDTQLLPGVSAQARLISFREEMDYNGFNNLLSIEEIHERIEASNLIRSLDPGTSIQSRCMFLHKFDVRYVVAPSKEAQQYAEIVRNCGVVKTVFSTADLVVLEIQ